VILEAFLLVQKGVVVSLLFLFLFITKHSRDGKIVELFGSESSADGSAPHGTSTVFGYQ